MELAETIRQRRMVRAFTAQPVAPEVVDGLIDLARRAPSAGHTQPWSFVVLEGPAQTAPLWEVTLPPARRADFRWPGLLDAPVVIIPWVSPSAYVSRYAEPDKAATGLGSSSDAWPVPYWWIDGGMAVNTLLLGAVDAGLGALFYGLFDHEPAVRTLLGVPADQRALGAIALGHPAPSPPGRSASRPRPGLDTLIHRGRW